MLHIPLILRYYYLGKPHFNSLVEFILTCDFIRNKEKEGNNILKGRWSAQRENPFLKRVL